jgi:glycerol-3-phosphate cytidylyltransferase-like family protein
MAKDKYAEFRPETKKVRKKRKPMTEEQRAQAGERLKLAREKRQKDNPPTYAGISPKVIALDDDETFSLKNVREWIKTQKEYLTEFNRGAKAGEKGAIAKAASCTGYIRHMEAYLRSGDWIDDRYGANADNVTQWTCTTLAYDSDGVPKRSKGVFYPDLGYRWGFDPDEVEEGVLPL